MGYSPRKRARSITARVSTWPEGKGDGVKLQGFAGYKAGMTHALIVDYRPRSTTAGQEVQVPVTVLEVPPMKVCGLRLYEDSPYGMKVAGEIWASKLDKELARRLPVPKEYDEKAALAKIEKVEYDEIRAMLYTQPVLVSGLPKKKPELMEIRIGGGVLKDRLEYGKSVLGKAVTVKDFITGRRDDRRLLGHQGEGLAGRHEEMGHEAPDAQEQQAQEAHRHTGHTRGRTM